MSDLDIRTFVLKRKKEIFFKIRELRRELSELKVVERTLGSKDPAGGSQRNSSENVLTIKDMIVSVLANFPNGLNAHSIIAEINKNHSKSIGRPSLSPQLSRLKESNILSVHNGIWSLNRDRMESLESDSVLDDPLT